VKKITASSARAGAVVGAGLYGEDGDVVLLAEGLGGVGEGSSFHDAVGEEHEVVAGLKLRRVYDKREDAPRSLTV